MKMKTYLVELKSDVSLSISVEVKARSEDEARDKAESLAWTAVNNLHTEGNESISIDHPIEVEVVESEEVESEEEDDGRKYFLREG